MSLLNIWVFRFQFLDFLMSLNFPIQLDSESELFNSDSSESVPGGLLILVCMNLCCREMYGRRRNDATLWRNGVPSKSFKLYDFFRGFLINFIGS